MNGVVAEDPEPDPFPTPPKAGGDCDCELEKIRYQARVDLAQAEAEADRAKEKVELDTEFGLEKSFQESLIEIAKDSTGRAQSGAEALRNAAAAIGAIYTGILGLAFSVTDRPLPLRGVIPALFLGLSVVMATAYVAIISRPRETTEWPIGGAGFRSDAQERTGSFIKYVAAHVRNNAHMSHAALLALGFGVIFLPVPFLTLGSPSPNVVPQEWPSTPRQVANIELQKILYQAQVAEIAEARRVAGQTQPVETLENGGVRAIYIVGGLGLLLVLAVFTLPLLASLRISKENGSGTTGRSPEPCSGTRSD